MTELEQAIERHKRATLAYNLAVRGLVFSLMGLVIRFGTVWHQLGAAISFGSLGFTGYSIYLSLKSRK